ncbi:MAG: helix-turn-helix transcriptional regulator [Deltaproteobacteria bacterium]|nr:helix-turn-helix transcriptional regulator [Deltaproteobacteria bacterium]
MEISEYFRLAIQLYIKKLGWGSQKRIATAIGIQQSYLSEFLNRKRAISENARVRFAEYINFNYEELIALGRKLSRHSAEQLNEQSEALAGRFKPELLQLIRKKNNVAIKDFARILYISETEYIFKEEGLLPFTFMELSILFQHIGLTQSEFNKRLDNDISFNIEFFKNRIKSLRSEEKQELKSRLLKERSGLKKKFAKTYRKLNKAKKNIEIV